MSASEFTIDDLKRILREGAGADEATNLEGDILDADFETLGYESLALLETIGRIEREYDISLDDEVLANAATPRELIAEVFRHLELVQVG
ncbi:acyl carrier protein [Streptacidiphilus anmyonensis]|uniref:acyl carrier protein n=1 Tax=Streptacidiphilus anmyonensis TaxID=405782 RepID=UPI0005A5EA20|nr:phosphopantetheine-binding protein [Streptacidiphilus anmyonensis]